MKLLTFGRSVPNFLSVSRQTVMRMIIDGALPGICLRAGRRKKILRVDEADLEKFVQNLKNANPNERGRHARAI